MRIARGRLRENPHVTIVQDTFEDWPLEREAFDLIAVAQAFHWLSPEVRFVKSADALREGGALAVFGNSPVLERTPLRRDLDEAYARLAPSIRKPVLTRWYADALSMRALFAQSGRFGPVTTRVHPWSQRYDVDAYLDLLRTHADHRLLPEDERERLLAGVREILVRHGGAIMVHYEAHLHLARRTSC